MTEYPGGFILLGAVFLATTGAEALYADLGHCGRLNIQVSWIFVKIALLINYFGQGAWLLVNGAPGEGINPFYGIMPKWFLLPGIIFSYCSFNYCQPGNYKRFIYNCKGGRLPELLAKDQDIKSH